MIVQNICTQGHINMEQFDSEDILDNTSLCFNSKCRQKYNKNSNAKQQLHMLICQKCLKCDNSTTNTVQKTNIKENNHFNIHRQHKIQTLTLDNIIKQLTTMIIRPQKLSKDYLHRAAIALHKFQVITQIRQKIQQVQAQIQKQILVFLNDTEILINQCAAIKQQISRLTEKAVYVEDCHGLAQFVKVVYENFSINDEYLLASQQEINNKSNSTHKTHRNFIKSDSKQKNIPKLIHQKLQRMKTQSTVNSEQIHSLQKSKQWQLHLKNINQCYQMFRDYAIKIVQICTVQSSDQQDDFHSNLATSTKLYRKLQNQIIDKVKNENLTVMKHSKTLNDINEDFSQTQSKCMNKQRSQASVKKTSLNISLQTQFSYQSDKSSSVFDPNQVDNFNRNPQQQDFFTPRKQISRLKRAFKSPRFDNKFQPQTGDNKAKYDVKAAAKIQKQAKNKQEKKIMFQKILDIYQYNYQDPQHPQQNTLPRTIKQKQKHFVRR